MTNIPDGGQLPQAAWQPFHEWIIDPGRECFESCLIMQGESAECPIDLIQQCSGLVECPRVHIPGKGKILYRSKPSRVSHAQPKIQHRSQPKIQPKAQCQPPSKPGR